MKKIDEMSRERQEELIKEMKYITVLDFEVGRIFQYKTDIILSEHQHRFYEDRNSQIYNSIRF